MKATHTLISLVIAPLAFCFAMRVSAKRSLHIGVEQATPGFAQSKEGFRLQVATIVQAFKTGDTALGYKLIDQFRLPAAETWFSAHLTPQQADELAKRYDRLYNNFSESFEHTVEAVVSNKQARLSTNLENGKGETPTGVLRPDAKLSGIVSIKPPALFYGLFQTAVKDKDSTSWADTFVYEDGAFRFIGFGAQPFWAWQDGSEGGAPPGGSFSTPAILIHKTEPLYPVAAMQARVEGNVVLKVWIDKEGHIEKSEILQGNPLLTQAAVETVRQWRFKPATLGGMPIESEVTVTIGFSPH